MLEPAREQDLLNNPGSHRVHSVGGPVGSDAPGISLFENSNFEKHTFSRFTRLFRVNAERAEYKNGFSVELDVKSANIKFVLNFDNFTKNEKTSKTGTKSSIFFKIRGGFFSRLLGVVYAAGSKNNTH